MSLVSSFGVPDLEEIALDCDSFRASPSEDDFAAQTIPLNSPPPARIYAHTSSVKFHPHSVPSKNGRGTSPHC